MDYFFCCLRTNDDLYPDQSLLIKEPVLSKSPKPVIYRRPFLPLQINRDDEDSKNSLSEILMPGNEERKLKTEDGFINVCDTLTKTPAKTRKLCGKYKDSSPSSEDFKPPTLHSCLSNTFTQSVNMEQQTESPMTPTEVEEDWIQEPGRNKYVHFKGESNEISSGPESAGDLRESTPLPYPTPLKLTDEMQTPGTVFPATFETLKNRKYHHIRSQYVYPVHNLHQWKSLKEEGSSYSNQMTESLDMYSSPTAKGTVTTTLSDEDKKGCGDETPSDNKPIMGAVSADWNEEEFCSISPKWLNRNGIQNTDKEDENFNWQSKFNN